MEKYKVFEKRHRKTLSKSFGYIPLHFVYDVKSDGTRKVRLVAGCNVIKSPDCPLYSTVVKTEMRTLTTLAVKLNLQIITGDVGGAYDNAQCAEMVWTHPLDENGLPIKNTDYVYVILCNLYGLKSGASSWWIHFASTLRDLGFTSFTADDNVCFKPRYKDQHKLCGYDYIIVHVDDFIILAKDAESYMVKLQQLYKIRHVTPITESSTVYLRMDIRLMPHEKRGLLLSAHTYLMQALSTARILFDYDTQDDLKGRKTVLSKLKSKVTKIRLKGAWIAQNNCLFEILYLTIEANYRIFKTLIIKTKDKIYV